jgi:hypothetical protein
MNKVFRSTLLGAFCLVGPLAHPNQSAFGESNQELLDKLKRVEVGDAAAKDATQVAAKLRQSSSLTWAETLEAMKGATPIGRNWLLGLANTKLRSRDISASSLEKFLLDLSQDPEARYRVYEALVARDPASKGGFLGKMLDDPSPELRYAAIEHNLSDSSSIDQLKSLLSSARHPNQIVDIIARLEKKEVKIDQLKHFGFLDKWNLIGPFDHVGSKNFETALPIEKDWQSGQVKESYDGKTGLVKWMEFSTTEKDGNIDLATIYNKEKGCIVYATTEFESPIEGPAEIRLGCINGHKIWLNGKQVMSNEVYHSSSQIDQYIEPIVLQKGTNRILIKICQNEQSEPWAQRFQFLVRITDATGKAIIAAK